MLIHLSLCVCIYIYTHIQINIIDYKIILYLTSKKLQKTFFCQFVFQLILGYGMNKELLATQLKAQWCMNHCVKRVRVCGSLMIATLNLIKEQKEFEYLLHIPIQLPSPSALCEHRQCSDANTHFYSNKLKN